MSSPYASLEPESVRLRRPTRTWRDKFGDALRGLKLGIRGQSSFFVHFFFAALVIAGAIVLRCDAVQWGLLLMCIGMVLTAELFNSAIETLFRGLEAEQRERCFQCLHISAGAVLLTSLMAVGVGVLVFVPRFMAIMGMSE